MRIGIASDHRGVEHKKEILEWIKSIGYEAVDYSPLNEDTDDYPDFAFMIGHAVRDKEIDFGVLVCRTGIGVSIAANKVKGVRCARVFSKEDAYLTRTDNNANVITFPYTLPFDLVKEILTTFFETPYSDHPRHHRRVDKIDAYTE